MRTIFWNPVSQSFVVILLLFQPHVLPISNFVYLLLLMMYLIVLFFSYFIMISFCLLKVFPKSNFSVVIWCDFRLATAKSLLPAERWFTPLRFKCSPRIAYRGHDKLRGDHAQNPPVSWSLQDGTSFAWGNIYTLYNMSQTVAVRYLLFVNYFMPSLDWVPRSLVWGTELVWRLFHNSSDIDQVLSAIEADQRLVEVERSK